jgi:hypothetical protein
MLFVATALKPPERVVRGYVGLAGVDVEAEYRINFYRLVAAKYWTELPAG